MSNTTKNAKNRSHSKFLGQRRKSFLTKRTAKLGFNFLRINKGSLEMQATEMGTYKAIFSSKKTGRKAHAFGADFHTAYQNLVKMFYLKYAA